MTRRGSKRAASDRTAITRIWIGHPPDGSDLPSAHAPETPETGRLLDRVVAWAVEYLQGQSLDVRAGRDGALRTLEFDTESDCLDAHDRLLAAKDQPNDFRFRFVLRPSGVTILVVS